MSEYVYDRTGRGYRNYRVPDPRLERAILEALGDAGSVVNVGAGAGSYEPRDRPVVAVEPSRTMIRQRSSPAPVVRAVAEALPFAPDSFDAALAVLTVHHWRDPSRGLGELRRVSRDGVVLFTWDPRAGECWLDEYFVVERERSRRRFPDLPSMAEALGTPTLVRKVPIPHDCTDGFLGAYWRRPRSYLDPGVRGAISHLAEGVAGDALPRLARDLDSGAWERRHGSLLDLPELDLGYRVVVWGRSA